MTQVLVERKIRCRGYELDPEAKIPAAVFLRYMEHLRWESLTQHPGLASLFQGWNRMVVVGQQLQLLRDLSLGAELDGTLELGHVGNTSLQFVHRFDSTSQGHVARGVVTAVFLGTGGRPTPLPELIRAALPGGGSRLELAPRLEGQAPADAWSTRRVVRASELDLLRHVNHANYLVYIEDARAEAAAAGVHGEAGAGRFRAGAMDYHQQAVLGDRLELLSWPLADEPGTLGFEIRKQGEQAPLTRARIQFGAA